MSSPTEYPFICTRNRISIKTPLKNPFLMSKNEAKYRLDSLSTYRGNNKENIMAMSNTVIKESNLQYNNELLKGSDEIRILKKKIEHYKLLYEEGKKSWIRDTRLLFNCISILKDHIDAKFPLFMSCFLKIIHNLYDVTNSIELILNTEHEASHDDERRRDQSTIKSMIMNSKSMMVDVVQYISCVQTMLSESKSEAIFQGMDMPIKHTLQKFEKILGNSKMIFNEETCNNNKPHMNNNYHSPHDEKLEKSSTHNLVSPPILKTIINNNLLNLKSGKIQASIINPFINLPNKTKQTSFKTTTRRIKSLNNPLAKIIKKKLRMSYCHPLNNHEYSDKANNDDDDGGCDNLTSNKHKALNLLPSNPTDNSSDPPLPFLLLTSNNINPLTYQSFNSKEKSSNTLNNKNKSNTRSQSYCDYSELINKISSSMFLNEEESQDFLRLDALENPPEDIIPYRDSYFNIFPFKKKKEVKTQ